MKVANKEAQGTTSGSNNLIPIAVAAGDAPEIMSATLRVLVAAGAPLDFRQVTMGRDIFLAGTSSGIAEDSWAVLRECRALLKAPCSTPDEHGFKNLDVTLRKSLALFASVIPIRDYTLHGQIDVVVIRENEEDLYAGVEHRQTNDVAQCLKLITRSGCERVVRYAFEFAVANGRKCVTCLTKDNLMRQTDGLFLQVFEEIGNRYPHIQRQHLRVDEGLNLAATKPQELDVVVTPNMYGDLIANLLAAVTGTQSYVPSANFSQRFGCFEPLCDRSSTEDRENPAALLLSACMMLDYLQVSEVAERIRNAVLAAIEDGVIGGSMTAGEQAAAVVARLDKKPQHLEPYAETLAVQIPEIPGAGGPQQTKKLVGVDVFVEWHDTPEPLGDILVACQGDKLQLKMITNRGLRVWPQRHPETRLVDHWRCRFEGTNVDKQDLIDLLQRIKDKGIDFIKTEQLCLFDGKPGYTLGQGQ
ncbi:MAG: NADP-dependent isocitrate dehydrogenase [Armatimonadetes bacterium]|nr:NADP-dependent isocitrate dehydrogenase [Armatimonadota bacterium]